MAKHQNIALFVPHQGCPQDCVFCNQARITGQKRENQLNENQVRETIDSQLNTMSKDDHVEIAYFGGSFTGLPRSYQTMLLAVAKEYIDQGKVHGIRLSTRPDYINESILRYLDSYGVTTIELGTQSMIQEVLDRTKRGHTVEHTKQAATLIKEHPSFQLGLQLLPGLPGDTLEYSVYSAVEVAKLKPDFVRIYPTLVIKGTELEWDYALGRYQPMTMDEAIERVAKMWLVFMQANVPVIRMGLQPSEDLREEGTVIAGPFHPAFRQLVEGYLFEDLLQVIKAEAVPEIIRIHPADETALRGRKGSRWKGFINQLTQSVILELDRNEPRQCVTVISAGRKQTYHMSQLLSTS
ncbi:elongator complex protein 3 [Caldalkalibacillus mannanilyticus]|uniref:elongator complex protein 3 n=1 Tax=Caldalkalibacillus mannanilyticus TaxID=1418 RepID=UPI00046A411F|nr:radical SAM protein [Caldalkalibacillus mannanilyticus]